MSAGNTKTKLPQDADSAPIQTLAPDDTSVVSLAISGSALSSAIPSGAEIVELAAQDFCYVAFGNSGVTATTGSRLMPPGLAVYKVPQTAPGVLATHISVLRVGTASGILTCTKMS